MPDLTTRITTLVDAVAPPIEIDALAAQLEAGPRVAAASSPSWRRLGTNSAVAVAAAAAVFVLVGGFAWLVGGTGPDVVDEPALLATTTPTQPTAPVVPPPIRAETYDLAAALAQVREFHETWNRGLPPSIVAELHPDSAHRQDRELIDIAVFGFNAQVEAQCTAASGADSDRANVSCHVIVEDDFYTPAQIWLQTGIVYEVTAEGIDILDGDPVWAITPTGTALAFLEDFDAELAGPLGDMVDPFGWIWLNPTAGIPNWGDGPPMRAYSVETVADAEIAVSAAWEFVEKDGDRWEPMPTSARPVIPPPESEPHACSMPIPVSDDGFEAWFLDLHRAMAALVTDTNRLGAALTETDRFDPGWDDTEPVSSALTLLLADLDAIESIASSVLHDEYGATRNNEATYTDEDFGWKFPDTALPVLPAVSHLEEISYGPIIYRNSILPAFFEMRSQGTAIGYFNSGGITAGPCGVTLSLVGLLDAMTESDLFRTS